MSSKNSYITPYIFTRVFSKLPPCPFRHLRFSKKLGVVTHFIEKFVVETSWQAFGGTSIILSEI